MAEKTIQQCVINIIAGQIGESADSIDPSHELHIDLNFDSLDLVEIMMAMELEFCIDINDDQFIALTTVQQVIDHVAEVVGRVTPAAAGVTRPTDTKSGEQK